MKVLARMPQQARTRVQWVAHMNISLHLFYYNIIIAFTTRHTATHKINQSHTVPDTTMTMEEETLVLSAGMKAKYAGRAITELRDVERDLRQQVRC
jgi:hypothetical protein